MEKDNSIKLFEEKFIRTHWDADKEKWYFSIVDVVAVLTGSENPRHYWTVLKGRLNNEGNETVTNCERLKMKAPDGKMRMTDVANTEQLLRLIQSIPSKKAEPFGSVVSSMRSLPTRANQSLKIAIDRALETYLKKGYSRDWINQRLKTIEVRKELTDEWEKHGITEKTDFAILTDEITKAWLDRTTRQYKELKGLKKESLRDKDVARRGGSVARAARVQYEKQTGKKAVSPLNAKNLKALADKTQEDENENNSRIS